jgi:N-acetylglutamate synthase-like GNAT family acetyltransferase
VSRSNMRVRPAVDDDVPALVALAETIKVAGSMFPGRLSGPERDERLAQRFNTLIASDRRTVLAAFDEADQLIGFVVVLEDELAPIDPTPVLQVGHLMLAAGAQHDAIGRSLLAAVVRLADELEIDHVLATAAYQSRDANRYLARLGFAPVAIRRIASTSVLRRTLGVGDVPDRVEARRRLLAGRGKRPARISAATRAASRGV